MSSFSFFFTCYCWLLSVVSVAVTLEQEVNSASILMFLVPSSSSASPFFFIPPESSLIPHSPRLETSANNLHMTKMERRKLKVFHSLTSDYFHSFTKDALSQARLGWMKSTTEEARARVPWQAPKAESGPESARLHEKMRDFPTHCGCFPTGCGDFPEEIGGFAGNCKCHIHFRDFPINFCSCLTKFGDLTGGHCLATMCTKLPWKMTKMSWEQALKITIWPTIVSSVSTLCDSTRIN